MAHGLGMVIGEVGGFPDKEVLQKLFPRVWDVECMVNSQDVDFLIVLGKASWHTCRYEKARCGGDFWVWNNNFQLCQEGSHPFINLSYKRSTSYYTA